MFRGLVGFAVIAVITPAFAAEPGPRTVVYVVRHAEKAGEPRRNPGLTRSGAERAAALAAVLAGTELTGIITSQFARTKATAAPVAKATGVEPVVIRYRSGDFEAHGRAVAAAIRDRFPKGKPPMSTQQKIIKNKVGLLNLAEEFGNVSRVCKVMGYSRDTFYCDK